MSLSEPKACTACRFHHLEVDASLTGPGIHLCTVRHALPDDPDDDRTPYEREESEECFLGFVCDLARKQGELCGPAGNMWTPSA
jgi:hypothetical protein